MTNNIPDKIRRFPSALSHSPPETINLGGGGYKTNDARYVKYRAAAAGTTATTITAVTPVRIHYFHSVNRNSRRTGSNQMHSVYFYFMDWIIETSSTKKRRRRECGGEGRSGRSNGAAAAAAAGVKPETGPGLAPGGREQLHVQSLVGCYLIFALLKRNVRGAISREVL